MAKPDRDLRVTLAPGGFFPQAFHWQGRFYRVLAVHAIRTCGLERRYRVASAAGYFELAVNIYSGVWHLRHAPNWLSRAWYQLHHGPRYPLPAWRRRRARVGAGRPPVSQAQPEMMSRIVAQPAATR